MSAGWSAGDRPEAGDGELWTTAIASEDGRMLSAMPPYDDTRLADHWDHELCEGTAQVLRETASIVVVAIARRGADLRPEDYAIWRDLHAELRGSGVDLLPVKALPAA